MKRRNIQLLTSFSIVVSGLLGSGCTKDQVLRLTYETLRQEDCHRNAFRTDYCDRSYSFEYAEYKEMRNDYFRQINESEVALTSPTRLSN